MAIKLKYKSLLKQKEILLITILVFLFFPSINYLVAQEEEIKFTHLFENYSLNILTCTYQDSKGVMWFGTAWGVYKYDGVTLRQYISDSKDSTSLSENYIRKIFEDSHGKLWIGTRNGLNLYNVDQDNFIKYYHKNNDPHSLPGNGVSDILEDSQGNLWIVASYLCLYNRDKNNFTTFTVKLREKIYEGNNNYFNFVYEDRVGNLWFSSWQDLYLFNRHTNQFTHYLEANSSRYSYSGWHIRSMLQDEKGTYWLASNKAGLLSFEYNNKAPKLIQYDYNKTSTLHLSDYTLPTLYLDKKGHLWIASENGGLFLFNRETKKFRCFTQDPGDENSIISNSIWSIYEDNAGRIWLGTFSNGYSLIDPYYEKFNLFRHITGKEKESISYNNISAFLPDDKENLWIATDGGGLNYFNRQKNEYISYRHDPHNPKSLSRDAVLSLCYDEYGNLWMGTWDGGVNVLSKDKRSFVNYNTQNSPLSNNNIFAIASDGKGRIYIGTYGGGLSVYHLKTNKWENFRNDIINVKSINDDYIFSLYIDKSHNIWIGTYIGGLDLLQWDANDHAYFIHYMVNPDSTGISTNIIQTMYEDAKGNFWVGSTNGLNLMNRRNGTFKTYQMEDGLPSNSIQSILGDDHGNLWISTLNGLSKFNREKGTFRNYNINDGIQGDRFNRNSAFKMKSGLMFFGGTNGFNAFHPDSVKDNPFPPKIILTGFKLFNKSVPIGENSPLKKHINEAKEITLSYTQSVFTIEFAALNYTHPEKNQYAFMMEGLEKEWNYVGNQKNATYTNLDAGNYVFRVKASNNDGVWNEKGIILKIIVLPPWWKTWWFRISLVIFGIVILLGIYRIRVWQLLQREKKLKSRIDEALAQVRSLHGLLPICSKCKKIRDDQGYWTQLESYLHDHTEASFSHGVCPECAEELYGPYLKSIKDKKEGKLP